MYPTDNFHLGYEITKLLPGASGDFLPPFMNHPQILEQIEVQRRLAMLTQQQQQASAVSKLKQQDKTGHHTSLKSSGANGASAFRPVQPKDRSKPDR